MILDVTCGARLMWHDKHHPGVIYADQRTTQHQLSDGREITISPNIRLDYRALPFRDNTFHLINLDPPHLQRAGATGWMCQKYGVLMTTWREDLRQCFVECFRVLAPGGTLTLKWNQTHIPLREVLELSPYPPLYGTRHGKNNATSFTVFHKPMGSGGFRVEPQP